MLQANNWRLSPAKPLQRLDPAMASKDLVVPVHEDRNVESEAVNTSGDLADLPRVVLPRILRIKPERTQRKVLDR